MHAHQGCTPNGEHNILQYVLLPRLAPMAGGRFMYQLLDLSNVEDIGSIRTIVPHTPHYCPTIGHINLSEVV